MKSRKLKFGVTLPQWGATWAEAKEAALLAEEVGFDSVWVADHFLGVGPDDPLEAWTEMSAVAAITRRIEIGFLVLCNSYRLARVAGEDGDDLRCHRGRPADSWLRRRLVRAGVRGLRLRVPGHPHPPRAVRGGLGDPQAHVDRRVADVPRRALPRRERTLLAEAGAQAPPAAFDRRRRRKGPAKAGRALCRHLEQPRHVPRDDRARSSRCCARTARR